MRKRRRRWRFGLRRHPFKLHFSSHLLFPSSNCHIVIRREEIKGIVPHQTDPIWQLGSEWFALCKQTQVLNFLYLSSSSAPPSFLSPCALPLPNVYRAKRGKNNLEQADSIGRIRLPFPLLARPLFGSLPFELFPSLCLLVQLEKVSIPPSHSSAEFVCLNNVVRMCVCCSFPLFIHAQNGARGGNEG